MGTIVLHAGMPKAGSSSIQRWLRDHSDELERADWHLFAYRLAEDGRTAEFGAPMQRRINSGSFVRRYNATGRAPAVLDELFERLDREARDTGRVLLSSEGFARLFAEPDPAFLERLDALAGDHEVRIAYYVRPQHQSIEAAWRQWGFRQLRDPQRYVELRSRVLSYASTLEDVGRIAPNVCFEMRLFDPSALARRNIVSDFLQEFLEIDDLDVAATDVWANPGLPLELANVLREARLGRFWSSAHHNAKIRPLKLLAAGWSIPPTAEIARSRLILQHYCHERFEADNKRLVRQLGWPIEHLVAPVEDETFVYGGLEELNDLWSSHQSAAEREMLYQALEQLLEAFAEGTLRAPMGGSADREGRWATSTAPATREGDRLRARRGDEWIAELERSIPGGAAHLVRRQDGLVFLVEGTSGRPVRSGLLVVGLETSIGTARPAEPGELDELKEGPPVEVFEDSHGQPFVVYGGERHDVRGMPMPHRVRIRTEFPGGETIDVTPPKGQDVSSPAGDPSARTVTARARRWMSSRRN